jgi:class 3 adenylate cyclase/DNA-binding transcriptional MerR regulator
MQVSKMITSKKLIEQTGISRATLNNYIGLGLIIKPEVKRIAVKPGDALTTIGYFPDWTLDKIKQIQLLKQQGISMNAICQQLSAVNTKPCSINDSVKPLDNIAEEVKLIGNQLTSDEVLEKRGKKISEKPLNLTVDKILYPAYMINYECGLIWLNEAAQQLFYANASIPERSEDRSIIPTLLDWAENSPSNQKEALFVNHFNAVKHRLNSESLSKNIAALNPSDRKLLENCYEQASTSENLLIQDTFFNHADIGNQRVVAISFREGVLFTYIPEIEDANQLLNWLSRRDSVIRTLLSQQLPVLTPLAAIVADLQNSVRICSELPPDEYFQLINEIWSTLDPIFRKYYGTYGKHTGDGMVYYFFPQPDQNYLMNAILCACEIRQTMKKITHHWAIKKGWSNQLYMNIGLNEGQEWLGTFKTNTSYELVVLGETMNVCGRLSDFARLGKIWATKNLVSKLTPLERETIDYGVSRLGAEEELFVSKSYAQISTLLDMDDPRHKKLMDISSSVVTEIRAVK